MTKRIILLWAFACLTAIGVSAQNADRKWFVGTGVGINVGFDGQAFTTREESHTGAGLAAELYFGRWFSPTVGLRAGYRGISSSNHFSSFGQVGFHYAHADFLINVARYFVPYIHTGFLWMDAGSPTVGAGMMFPIRVGSHWSIVPDIRYTALNGHAFKEGDVRFAGNITASIGVRYDFGKRVRRSDSVSGKNDGTLNRKVSRSKASKGIAIHFLPNQATLDQQAENQLRSIIDFLKEAPRQQISLTGHFNESDGENYDNWLSKQQVQCVRQYLEDSGVKANRIHIYYDSKNPVGKVMIIFEEEQVGAKK